MGMREGQGSTPWSRRRGGDALRVTLIVAVSALVLVPAAADTAAPRATMPAPLSVSAPRAAELNAVATSAPAANPQHPFSSPIWSPVREAAKISCVRTNCATPTGEYFHGYWAIDFIGRRGAPVHAAGAGVFHVGARNTSCSTTASMAEGTWGWVDHGGGVVSRYHHLDSLAAEEGQLVTPSTLIGRMGHWGDMQPCTTDYLHFEVREGGVKGTRVDPKSLRACTASGAVNMPAIFGAASFDDLPRRRYSTPAATSDCVTAVWNRTPSAPTLSISRRPSAARLAWGTPPSGTSAVRVAYEVWSPSLRTYGATRYATFSASRSSATLGGLTNGRTYRMRIAFRNAHGFSAWSAARTVVPAGVPSAPRAPRFLTSPTRDYIHYGWWKSAPNGSSVTRYVTQVRCYKDGRYRGWTTKTTSPGTYYYNHRGLSKYSLCQVRVRADNAMGSSSWSTTSTIRK